MKLKVSVPILNIVSVLNIVSRTLFQLHSTRSRSRAKAYHRDFSTFLFDLINDHRYVDLCQHAAIEILRLDHSALNSIQPTWLFKKMTQLIVSMRRQCFNTTGRLFLYATHIMKIPSEDSVQATLHRLQNTNNKTDRPRVYTMTAWQLTIGLLATAIECIN